MIYKIDLNDMITLDQAGFKYVMQNQEHVLYQSDQELPATITAIESFADSELPNLYAANEWQQPREE